jgi:hypothetical protein
LHDKSVARWQRYRSHLGPLIAEFGNGDIPLDSTVPDQLSMAPNGSE